MRPTILLTALASLSAVHAAAIANPAPAPAPAPEPTGGSLVPPALLGGGVTGITGVVGQLGSVTNILGPVSGSAGLLGGLLGGVLGTAGAVLESLGDILTLPGILLSSIAPISGATGALPLLGSIAPGSVSGDDANKLISSVTAVIAVHKRILERLLKLAKAFEAVPILGPILYSVLLAVKGALDALIVAVLAVLDPTGRAALTETVTSFNAMFSKVLVSYKPAGVAAIPGVTGA